MVGDNTMTAALSYQHSHIDSGDAVQAGLVLKALAGRVSG